MAKLMKHGVKNLMKWEEIPISVWPSKSQLHLNATPNIQPQKSRIGWAAISLIHFNSTGGENTMKERIEQQMKPKQLKNSIW